MCIRDRDCDSIRNAAPVALAFARLVEPYVAPHALPLVVNYYKNAGSPLRFLVGGAAEMQDQTMEAIAEAGKIFLEHWFAKFTEIWNWSPYYLLATSAHPKCRAHARRGIAMLARLQSSKGRDTFLVDAEDMRVLFEDQSKSRRQQGIAMAISRHFEANFSRRNWNLLMSLSVESSG